MNKKIIKETIKKTKHALFNDPFLGKCIHGNPEKNCAICKEHPVKYGNQ